MMTIEYVEKGEGLFAAIEAAGHFLYRRDGEWVCSDEEAVQAIIDNYSPTSQPLSPTRFLYLKALLGVVDLWDQLEEQLRILKDPLYPLIYAQRAKTRFEYEKTLAFIQNTAPIWSQIDPEADLSEETLSAAWVQAIEAEV